MPSLAFCGGFGLALVKNNGCMRRTVRPLDLVAAQWVAFHYGAVDERHDPNAFLALLDAAAERFPSVEREDILSRFDLVLGNTLLDEPGEDRRIIGHGLTVSRF